MKHDTTYLLYINYLFFISGSENSLTAFESGAFMRVTGFTGPSGCWHHFLRTAYICDGISRQI